VTEVGLNLRTAFLRVVLLLFGCVALLVIVGPLALYWWGFTLLEELPEPPTRIRSQSELIAPWELVERTRQITVRPLHPWYFAGKLATRPFDRSPGEAAAYYVSSRHVYDALSLEKGPRHFDWHLANHSLTIWLTRHWTAEQIAEQVARLEERRLESIEQEAEKLRQSP